MLRLRRPYAAFLLLATALAGGPGSAGVEAYQHAHRLRGHGHQIHFEPRGGQDHDDACRAWWASVLLRAPAGALPTVRLRELSVFVVPLAAPALHSSPAALLPLSRAPPLTV
ncbi:MAG TPA: hypothetical protein VGQ69_05820 [Gemmatimonadales bacterium]|nr:hypothetical protein [Gemmatimonadales bacterium]HEV8598856.1 hypothetical protein [Gemmatimonadales bacterium]